MRPEQRLSNEMNMLISLLRSGSFELSDQLRIRYVRRLDQVIQELRGLKRNRHSQ